MRIFNPEEPVDLISGIDPRVRVIASFAFATTIALSSHPAALATGAAVSLVLAGLSRTDVAGTVRKLASVNAFMLLLILTLPLFIRGEAAFSLGGLEWSREGFIRAGLITLRANIILLSIFALLGSIAPSTLGYSLGRMGFPAKLTHTFLFMVRYIEVIHHEYHRLRNAMLLRGFHAGFNVHTFRSFGSLAGMLIVRSLDRAERILNAMKCRCFDSRFHVLTPMYIKSRDIIFAAAMSVAIFVSVWFEWTAIAR